MPNSPDFLNFLSDVMRPLTEISVRRMFGGAGLYAPSPNGPAIFAIVADDQVYLKTDDVTRADLEAAGAAPFRFEMQGEMREMRGYYSLPEEALDDPDVLVRWVRPALDAGMRAQAEKAEKAAKRKGKSR